VEVIEGARRYGRPDAYGARCYRRNRTAQTEVTADDDAYRPEPVQSVAPPSWPREHELNDGTHEEEQ
jgi:hypothetical protein